MLVSEITAFLENAYEVLNNRFFDDELPKVIITIQSSPKAYGHYVPYDIWKEETEGGYREINIGAETLNRPVGNVIATLIHEMVHFYCDINNIKDTSRNGVYHNKRFMKEAELRGLIIDYNEKIGFSITYPAPMLMDFVAQMGWSNVNLSRNGGYTSGGGSNGSGGSDNGSEGTDKGKKKSSTRKYLCPQCRCSVRATKEVHISCLDCNCEMAVEEK